MCRTRVQPPRSVFGGSNSDLQSFVEAYTRYWCPASIGMFQNLGATKRTRNKASSSHEPKKRLLTTPTYRNPVAHGKAETMKPDVTCSDDLSHLVTIGLIIETL